MLSNGRYRGELYALQTEAPLLIEFQEKAQQFIENQSNPDTPTMPSDYLFYGNKVDRTAFAKSLDVDQTGWFVDTLAKIDAVDSVDQNRCFSRALYQLQGVNQDHLRTLYKRGDRASLDEIYARNSKRATYSEFLNMLSVVEPVHGSALDVMSASEENIPAYLAEIVREPGRQEDLFLHNFPRHINQDNYPEVIRQAHQAASLYLRNSVDIPQHIITDIRLSFKDRFRPQKVKATDGSGFYNPTNEERSRKLRELKSAYRQVVRLAGQLGTESMIKLYDKGNHVNFDQYPIDHLKNTLRVIDKEPAFIAELKQKKVALHLSGIFGNHNGARLGTEVFDVDGVVIPFGVREPSSLYRPFILLDQLAKQYDAPEIMPSTVIISEHGGQGSIAFNGGTHLGFQLHAAGNRRMDGPVVSIGRSNLKRLVTKFVRPDEETGERLFIFNSCSQAAEGVSRDGYRSPSTAEVVARQSRARDRLVVVAADRPAVITKEDDWMVYYDPKSRQNLNAYLFYRRRFRPGLIYVDRDPRIPMLNRDQLIN